MPEVVPGLQAHPVLRLRPQDPEVGLVHPDRIGEHALRDLARDEEFARQHSARMGRRFDLATFHGCESTGATVPGAARIRAATTTAHVVPHVFFAEETANSTACRQPPRRPHETGVRFPLDRRKGWVPCLRAVEVPMRMSLRSSLVQDGAPATLLMMRSIAPNRRAGSRLYSVLSLSLAVLVMTPGAFAQCETEQLFAPLASPGDSFGQCMDLSGAELVVGSRYSATVFLRQDVGTPLNATDDVWSVQENLLGDQMADGFGSSVSLHQDHLLVGAPFVGGFATIGAAYIYVRNNAGTASLVDDGWDLQAQLDPPTSDVGQFGTSVSIFGDRIAVGDPIGHPAVGAPHTGFVLIARRDDSGTPRDLKDDQWLTEELLVPPGGDVFFGALVDLSPKELLVVGKTASFVNQVYRYVLDDAGTPADLGDDSWVHLGQVTAPPAEESGFGRAVSRQGTTLLIGGNDVAFEYLLNDGGTVDDPLDDLWTLHGSLSATDDTEFDDGFGCAVWLDGDRALVGAKKHGVTAAAGAAYLFERDSNADVARWAEIVQLTSSAGVSAKNFGVAGVLRGDIAVVGESGFFQFLSPGDSSIGAARVYAMAKEPWIYIDSPLAGTSGISPCLLGAGALEPDSTVAVVIKDATVSGVVALVVGFDLINAPFKGGVMVPFPQLVKGVLAGPDGGAVLSGRWPSNVPTGFLLCLQGWMADSSGPVGFLATNAVRAEAP